MKTIKFTLVAAVAVFGLTFFLTQCKKNTEVVVVQVHDTLKGKSISGLCTYPDFSAAMVKAPGAVVSLYLGVSKTGAPVATAYADTAGNYTFPYLLPNNYFVYAAYNTENQNNVKTINGINFETDPGYPVVMASANLTQNLALATVAPAGTLKVSITASDTGSGGPSNPRYAPFESHSKCPWWTEYSTYGNGGLGGTILAGGFNKFTVTEFFFDEANPANSKIKGYVLLSSINTFDATRDALFSGCVPKTLQVDTVKTGATTAIPVPVTDTAWYTAPLGTIQRYGKGYLAKGSMTAFYKSAANEIEPPRIAPCDPDTVSWDGMGPQYAGPFSQRITNPIDMYFEYQGKNKIWNAAGTTFNWFFIFEAEFTFTRQQYYVKTTSIANTIHVTPHVQLKGVNNVEY